MNATRTEAEEIMTALLKELETLRGRVFRVQNITNAIIEEGQEAVKKYEQITLDYYNDVRQSEII